MSLDSIIPVVNEQDEIIGYKRRGDITPNDIYRVTGLWITNSKGEVLLAQRKHTKKHDPGKWGPAVAGTIEKGETYNENIVKEMAEELRITNKTPQPFKKMFISTNYTYFVQWYKLTLDLPLDALHPERESIEEIRWIPLDKLKKDVQEHPEHYLQSFGERIQTLSE